MPYMRYGSPTHITRDAARGLNVAALFATLAAYGHADFHNAHAWYAAVEIAIWRGAMGLITKRSPISMARFTVLAN